MNPYALGFAMMQDIQRICVAPTEEDREWFPDIAGREDWRGALKEIWASYRDESFVRQFLSPHLIRKFKLFVLTDKASESEYDIDAIHDAEGYRRVRNALAETYDVAARDPDIQVVDVDLLGDRKLILKHKRRNQVPLAEGDRDKVMRHVKRLWGYDAILQEEDEAAERADRTDLPRRRRHALAPRELFSRTRRGAITRCSRHSPTPASIEARLIETEDRNLHLYGYGVKGFTLSMIETAVEIAGDALPAATVRQILAVGRELMRHPVEPLPGVRETLPRLAALARLVLVTKGDLLHQEVQARRLAASAITSPASRSSARRPPRPTRACSPAMAPRPAHAVMVGNSLRSDVWPALAAGAFAVHIPHEYEWARERAETPQDEPRFAQLEVVRAIAGLAGGAASRLTDGMYLTKVRYYDPHDPSLASAALRAR